LDLQQAADMLGVSPATVKRWARQGRLGVLRPSGEFRFEQAELRRWARNQGLDLHEARGLPREAGTPASCGPLAGALAAGSVLHEVPGVSPDEVLSNLVELAPLAESVDRLGLLAQLQAREHMASTALGGGVALPHPRIPSTAFVAEPTLVVALLASPVPWKALDGEPVHAVLLLLNPDPQAHLTVLSRVAFLLRQESFIKALRERADAETLRGLVASLEEGMEA
jgi:PTS system nitrogen regulatory IIA component